MPPLPRRRRRLRAAAAAAVAALALSALAGASSAQAAPQLMLGSFGENWQTVFHPAYAAADYMGARYARQIVNRGPFNREFNWGPVDDFVNDAVARDMRPYLTLANDEWDGSTNRVPTTGQYAEWCGAAASRYSQPGNVKVLDYAVWNEPNLDSVGNLRPSEYLPLYQACRVAIQAVNGDANLYYGELSTAASGVDDLNACQYLIETLPASGPVRTEGVAIHPYQFVNHPREAIGTEPCRGIGRLGDWRARLADLTGRLASRTGDPAPIVVSEFGYCVDRTPAPPGQPYVAQATRSGCPQNATGERNLISETDRAAWLADAWQVAAANQVTIFNYHTVVKRPAAQWMERNPDGTYKGRWMWESGLIDNPHPAPYPSGTEWPPSVRALRTAAGTQGPSVTGAPASSIRLSSAVLNGTVNPNGFRTTYRFEYGTDTAYGRSVPEPRGQIGAGAGATAVSHTITGLQANTTYHYRLVARSRTGESVSADATFRTPQMPRPSVVVTPDGRRHIFYRTENDQLREWRWDGLAWTNHEWGENWRTASDPSAVVTSDGAIEVFHRTPGGQMRRWRIAGTHYVHADLGVFGAVAGTPSAVATGVGGVDVFFRTGDGKIGRWWVNGNAHNDTYYGDPGTVASDPTAVANTDGSLEAIYRNPANQISRWRMGDRVPIENGRGIATGVPAAVVTTGGSFEVFYRTNIGQLGRWWFNGLGWNPTEWGVGGTVGGDPAVMRTRAGRLEVVYRTPAGQLGRYWFQGSDYDDSVAGVNGALAGDPAVVVTSSGDAAVYYGAADGSYWEVIYDPSSDAMSFVRLREAPAVTVHHATDIGVRTATVRGTVDPRGLRTRWTLEYGTTPSYGSSIPVPDGDVGDGEGPVDVTAQLGGLLAGTRYHYRLVATSAMGTRYSENRTFKTAPLPKPSVVVRSDGGKHLFYRMLNGQLGEWRWDGSSWRHFDQGFAGTVVGNPTAVVTDDDVIEVFHRNGGDGRLKRWRFAGGGYNEFWYDDAGALSSDPVALATGGEAVEVFAGTSIRQLGRWSIDGAADVYGDYGHQGNVTGTPSAVESEEGVLDVVHRSELGQLFRWTITASGPNDDEYGFASSVVGAPSLVVSADGVLDSVYRMANGQLGRWTLWGAERNHTDYGTAGSLVGDPSAISYGDGSLDSFHRTDDGRLGRWWLSADPRTWNPTTWGADGSIASDPTAIRLPDGTLNVFYGRPDGGYAFHEFRGSNSRYQPIG